MRCVPVWEVLTGSPTSTDACRPLHRNGFVPRSRPGYAATEPLSRYGDVLSCAALRLPDLVSTALLSPAHTVAAKRSIDAAIPDSTPSMRSRTCATAGGKVVSVSAFVMTSPVARSARHARFQLAHAPRNEHGLQGRSCARRAARVKAGRRPPRSGCLDAGRSTRTLAASEAGCRRSQSPAS